MIGWAIQSAFATSLLIVAVLLLRRPVANAFGARAAYALWLAPAARAVLPPLDFLRVAMPISTQVVGPVDFRIVTTQGGSTGLHWLQIVAVVWLAGAAFYLALNWWRHQRFLDDALANGTPLVVRDVPYDVVSTSSVDGPLATGLIHPVILVPIDFEERFTIEQQRLALLHEQAHHRRGDIWACLAALIVTAILWFNPFAHMALRAFRRDMEAACDARVIAEAGAHAASPYAETILRCVGRPAPRSLCALTAVDELKGRLEMLSMSHGKLHKFAGMLTAGGLTLAGLALAAPAQADKPQGSGERHQVKRVEIREVINGKGDDSTIEHDGAELGELKCPGERFEAAADTGGGREKRSSRFILCAGKGESLLAALEKAVGTVEKGDDMSPEQKAEILAKIRSKIAELRAKG